MTETLITREQRDLADGRGVAVFNAALTNRYLLVRRWAAGPPTAVIIMLNPSTADEAVNDQTITRCVDYAKREGAHALEVVNLFALRATLPSQLMTAPDPVGEHNDRFIREHALPDRLVIAAWGALGDHAHDDHRNRATHVTNMLTGAGVDLWCLGLTMAGYPRHPSRLAKTEPLVPYQLAAVRAALTAPTPPGRTGR
jgi:hypothetical protein